MSRDGRAQVNSTLGLIGDIGLKLGAVAVGLALAYLLYVVFGGKLANLKTLKAPDQQQLMQTIGWAKTLLKVGAVALVIGLCIRFFYDEMVGLVLTIAGAVLYFFSPSVFSSMTMGELKQQPIYQGIVNEIATMGLIFIVPGILLLVRDVIARVANRFGAWHEVPTTGVEDGELHRGSRKHGAYEMCWNMACCNERTKRLCKAWAARRPCWQIKSGCMCDEDLIKRAYEERTGDRQQVAEDTRPKAVLSAQQKAARCRNCTIFLEHQRQKFKIATPAAVVLVVIIYALVYSRLADFLFGVFKGMDRFMSFMTYHHGPTASFATQGHVVTTLAMICIGVALLSFTLRTLEYMIFDLQI